MESCAICSSLSLVLIYRSFKKVQEEMMEIQSDAHRKALGLGHIVLEGQVQRGS